MYTSRKIVSLKKMKKGGGFGDDAGAFFGDAGKAIADTTLSAAGLSNVIKDDAYKSESADSFRKGAKIAGTVSKVALPFALSAVGVPAPITMAAQAGLSQINPEDDTMGVKTASMGGAEFMRMGGMAQKQLINVEKNELEVDPNTGKVIKDVKNKPPHPKNDNIVNLKGNTQATIDNVIIPKNKQEEYLSESLKIKMNIKFLFDLKKKIKI